MTLRRFRLRFGRSSAGTSGCNPIFWAAKSSWQLAGGGFWQWPAVRPLRMMDV
jgi:hypothetical protein